MQFDNQKTRNVADVAARIMAGETVSEELKGNQHKIDANKNNKVDAHDFELLRAQKEKEKANSMKYGKQVKEETGLTESHFKVGDTVKCKASGMKGEVVKLDKEHGEEDDKYYTVKREDGKMVKYAPNELSLMKESAGATKEKEEKFHKDLDTLVHKTFGKRKEEMKEESIDEAMFPGTKEYQKKYGESPQQKLKKTGDKEKTSSGEMEKTEKGVKHTRRFSEMLETYKEKGLKSIAEMFIKEEPDNEQFTKELDAQKKKASEKKSPEDEARVAMAKVDAVKEMDEEVEQIDELSKDAYKNYLKTSRGEMKAHKSGSQLSRYADTAGDRGYKEAGKNNVQDRELNTQNAQKFAKKKLGYNKEEVELDEREMTDGEMKKREEIVKSMKKGMQGFKDRYGDRAKNVMYATATKQAMKEENLQEISKNAETRIKNMNHPDYDKHYNDGAKHMSEPIGDESYVDNARMRKKEILKQNPHKKGTMEHQAWHHGASNEADSHIDMLKGY